MKYSTFDRELLAIYLSIKHFRYFVEGRQFTIFTDHKPISTAINSKSEKSPRQTRHLSYISQFTTDVIHVSGKGNVVADYLSRMRNAENAVVERSFELKALIENQETDEELKELLENPKRKHSKFKLQQIVIPVSNEKLWCEVSTNSNRPYVPEPLRKVIFNKLHALSHPGIRGSRKLISSRYFWPNLNKNINQWAKTCIACQKAKIVRHTKTKSDQIEIPSGRFDHIHIDLVGPLPSSEGFSYILTTIDRFTRWPEA